ncbi:MAG: citrate lyase acyl carrier protein [Pelosinus sp.]|nr:citrate lyase acyl carrier protein [Pelosinus sp.]
MATALKPAQAGTLESSDIMVTAAPRGEGEGILIEIESIVFAQYGTEIRELIEKTVKEQGITDIYIKAVDRGALECTIKARTFAALSRAGAPVRGEI